VAAQPAFRSRAAHTSCTSASPAGRCCLRRGAHPRRLLFADCSVTLGYDCSGTIVAVGPGGTASFAPGDEVAGVATGGALAAFTAVHESMLCKKPSGVSFADAAACVTSGLSALQALQYAQDKCGKLDKVLVTAGGGGCGHIAIQMAKGVFGASTVATTASAAKNDFVKACGADVIIDYNDTTDAGDFTKALQGFDFALDLTGETKECLSVISSGGCVVPLCSKGGGPTMPDGEMLAALVEAYRMPAVPGCILSCLNCCACCRDKRVHNMVMLPIGSDLAQVLKHVDSGTIKATVDRVYPLTEAPAAFDHVEQGHVTGRVIVEVLAGAAAGCAQVNPL
jgi:NADPH:quinone reductase-like Zn-dependent oxidoreductase